MARWRVHLHLICLIYFNTCQRCSFFALVDLLSILPYWCEFIATVGSGKSPFTSTGGASTFIRCLRLLRLLKAEKYTEAFTIFDDVLRDNADVLVVTGFSALVMWVLFASLLYVEE